VGFFVNTLGGAVTYTAGTGYTLAHQFANSDQLSTAVIYKTVTVTGAQTATATLSTSKEYGAVVATFLMGSGGGGAGTSTKRQTIERGITRGLNTRTL
jgi:hypothetical protein